MKKDWLVKTLALAVVVLFISVSFQPIIAENTISVDKESDYNNVDFEEAKEYLFQTIIDISNYPEVKEFLNEHKHDLITRNDNNLDYKNAIQKISSQNPKLLKSILFIKPKMSFEYLEKNYNKGLEIVDILGEEESLRIEKSFNITNPELFIELKNIIADDKELSNKISVLEKMNNNIKSNLDFFDHPIICTILFISFIPGLIVLGFLLDLEILATFSNKPVLAKIFSSLFSLIMFFATPFIMLFLEFVCYSILPTN